MPSSFASRDANGHAAGADGHARREGLKAGLTVQLTRRAQHAGQDEIHEYALQGLDRIAKPIGGKVLLGVLWPLIESWAKAPEWQKRHAALMCIAQIAEGCAKMLMQDAALKSLVAICCTAAVDSHAIVKWCACQAIGQVCTGALCSFLGA